MSNRTETDVSYAAELKAAHLAQIEALTAEGLTDEERVSRFADAARFGGLERDVMRRNMNGRCFDWPHVSVAYLCWCIGSAPYSLFGDMPGCLCPVNEVANGEKIDGIPARIPARWNPTAEELQPFACIQQERRLSQ